MRLIVIIFVLAYHVSNCQNIDDAIRQVNINQKDIANNIEIAATKSFAAAEKGFADLNINTKTVTKDVNVGKIDSFIKSAALSDQV